MSDKEEKEVFYKCADCGSYEIIEGSKEDCEKTYEDPSEKVVCEHKEKVVISTTSGNRDKCIRCGKIFWEEKLK